VIFIQHYCFGVNFIHTFHQIFHPKNSSTCNYHPKSSLMFNFHPNILSIFWLSSMYTWKNIFHVIPTWHKDIQKIFCPCHQNIPNMFVLAHRFMFTFTCLPPSIVDCNCIHLLKICVTQNPTFIIYNSICSMVQIIFPLALSPNVSDDFQ
jgi:hypothetical protein